jgi:hypothetical protein
MVAAALERARLKRMVHAKRDIARLANELERAMLRAYAATQELAINILDRRGYDVRLRMAAEEIGGPRDGAAKQ